MWSFDHIEAEGIPLRINGQLVSTDDVKKRSGQSFELEVGDNVVSFEDSGFGSVLLTLNGTSTHTVPGNLHLSFSEMACCIGEKCLLWPPPSKKPTPTPTHGGYAITDVEAEDVTLKVNGKVVTTEELKTFGGKSFELFVNNNVAQFEALPPNSAKLTLNGKTSVVMSDKLHLNFSPMAICIGDKCLPWPNPVSAPVSAPVKGWTISELEVEDGLQLKVDGKPVSVDQVKELAGKSFTLYAGKNHVTFENKAGGVSLVLNSSGNPVASLFEPLHLNLSSMAVCIGDKCLLWPQLPPEPISPIIPVPTEEKTEVSSKHGPAGSDEEFLAGVKAKLGEKEYAKLLSILRPESLPAEDPHEQYRKQVKHADTKEQWEQFMKEAGSKPVIVDCSAVWCKPCKKIAPDFAKLSKQYGKEAFFLGVDIQVNPYVKGIFSVESLPAFLFVKNGAEIGRLVGDDVEALRNGVNTFVLSNGETIGVAQKTSEQKTSEPKEKEEKRTEFDYVVIGGGSGGMASAKEAAKHGAHVAIFDYVKPSSQNTSWGLGGTCVNVGCVPKKLMHHASLIGDVIHQEALPFGWIFPSQNVKHNWKTLVETVQDHVKKLNFFYEKGLKTAAEKDMRNGTVEKIKGGGSVTYFNALATLSDAHTVSYHNSKTGESGSVKGKHILIAVGGRPHVPPSVPGAKELSITSDDLFSLTREPGRTLCVGAGYISLECGGFLRGLGFPVSIAVRSVPLRTGGFDRDCVTKLVKLMEALGTRFLMQTDVRSMRKSESGTIIVKFYKTDAKEAQIEWEEEFDTVLYATGREADTHQLNLAQVGVNTSARGTILADSSDSTSVPNIFAIGDVAHGRPELTPVAIQAGEFLARRLFAGKKQLMDYHYVPTTVFTPFEYGIVGYSEEAAQEKFGKENIEVYLSEFSTLEIGAAHWKNLAKKTSEKNKEKNEEEEEFPTNCLAKLVCVKNEEERVVGIHFVGPNAGEITQGMAVCIRLGAKKKDFDECVGIHPTDAESFTVLFVSKSSGEQWESAGGCGGGKCG